MLPGTSGADKNPMRLTADSVSSTRLIQRSAISISAVLEAGR